SEVLGRSFLFQVEISGSSRRLATVQPSMQPSADTEALIIMVSEEADKLALTYGWEDAGGGSDGNFTAAVGTPTLDGFGPMGAGFHSDKEYLLIDSIEPRIQLLTNVLRRLIV
ncbi:M20/M25/M40 family metallo-hydrolase, partial [Photobacterium damselae]|uniref:M20/M25/M40 family metallo-hydrolase n=2 Tax=Photobacterium damselae TaxID=38293 RepID=UPI001FD76D61